MILLYWTNWGDCGKPCTKEEYRFQLKSFPIAKKSGWFWKGKPKDSIDQFTIVHSGYFPFHETNDTTAKIISMLAKHREQYLLVEELEPKITTDFIEKINDRYFYIIVIDLFDSTKAQYSKKVFGGTLIRGNDVEFQYELLTNKTDSTCNNFIENSRKLLRTIKISNRI